MVISCVAINCFNRQKKESGISFHVFPHRYPEVRAQWVAALRRKNFVPSRNSRLCSAHFLESDYQLRPNSSYPLLKEDAVPSVFDFATPLRHNKKRMNPPGLARPSPLDGRLWQTGLEPQQAHLPLQRALPPFQLLRDRLLQGQAAAQRVSFHLQRNAALAQQTVPSYDLCGSPPLNLACVDEAMGWGCSLCRPPPAPYTEIITFHRFPQDENLRKKWVLASPRKHYVPTPASRICSRHFKEYDFEFGGLRRRLKRDAIPSIFDLSLSETTRVYKDKKSHQVEFKPEMWEEKGEKTEEPSEEPPAKRGRGRPKKQVQNVKATSGIVIVKSEVVSCCALACTNTSENFLMSSLPQDPALRKLWVEKIDRLDWSPDDDSALCEVHFDEEMWDQDVGSDKALRPDAVPSLFLHGEAIKSWVTMDNTGNIADIIVDGRSTNDEESANGGSNHGSREESMDGSEQDEEEDPSMFVKREALEPEIDMVEGSEEDMVSREASSGEQFETIYCDSTFNDHEDIDDELYDDKEDEDSPMVTPTSTEEENPLADERSSPILQDGEVSCLEDSTTKTGGSKYLVISMASKEQTDKEKVIKRRSSSQLTDEFQCPICDRRLSRRKNLEIHIEKLHPFGEISEYQKKRKETEQLVTKKQEDAKKYPATHATAFKKPPPPLKPIVPQCLISPSIPVIPLNTPTTLATTSAPEGVLTTSFPIISFSSQSPLVSSSIQTTPSTMVTPSLVTSQPLATSQPLVTPTALIASPSLVAPSTAGTLITTSSMVTAPRLLDPSPAGGEMRKQFLLLLPKQTVIPKPPSLKKSKPPTPKPPNPTQQPSAATDDSSMYSVNLSEIPLDKRLRLKDKLRELVDAVVKKNLNPDKIIIAYDRT